MMLYLLLIIVSLLGVFAVVFAGSREKSGYSWVQFYARGKDAGFGLKEIELLRQVARKADLEDPASLFWSVNQLDQCMAALLRKARLTGVEQSKETQDFLAKLYAYRKKIEFDQPRYKKGITSSRNISELQPIRLLVAGVGVYESKVLTNTASGLTIIRPLGLNQTSAFGWKGRRVAVYFYRKDDAGYVFDSTVFGEVPLRIGSGLQIAHSDSLFRTQKRRSVRTKTQISAYLYIMKGEEPPEKIEIEPGLRCIIEDLSDTGYSVTIGGRAPAGVRLKAQFMLDGELIAMSGIVRSSDYSEETNRSLLHIEADPLTLATRNRIFAQVFGVNASDDPGAEFFRFDEEDLSYDAVGEHSHGLETRAEEGEADTHEESKIDEKDPSAGRSGPVEDVGGNS
jgi:hypothetical protein